eukprot:TRINITY_DN6721_c0_g1_i1.p1 TRINITY_DN6721_c0_g1~~TRINITY_DN6721_c0_g1_i1.p1  ORF type:complete len:688 (+),score=149.88 TRINITY_DN6721_c0_g1_i1:86-2065(+)
MVRHHIKNLGTFFGKYHAFKVGAGFAKIGAKHVIARLLGYGVVGGTLFAADVTHGGSVRLDHDHLGFGGLGIGGRHDDDDGAHDESLCWYSAERGQMKASPAGFEWLNDGVNLLWPHLDSGLRNFLNHDILPAIRKQVGEFIGSEIRLELNMGSMAPVVGPVAVRKVHGHTNAEGHDSLELHIGADYRGDLSVLLDTPVQTVNVGDLRIRGTCMVALRPLCNTINPVGGISITCPDQPWIDLHITSRDSMFELVNMYGLIKGAVDDVISGLLVMPNNIAVCIPTVTGRPTEKPPLQFPEPEGVLRVTVERAEKLKSSSWNPLATSNPYVVAKVGAEQWQSPVVKHTVSPVWEKGNTTDFVVYNAERQNLMLEVWSDSAIPLTPDSHLGRGGLPIADLIARPGAIKAVPVYDKTTGTRQCGDVRVSAEWLRVDTVRAKSLGAAPPLDQQRPAPPPGGDSLPAELAVPRGPDAEQLLSVRADRATGPGLCGGSGGAPRGARLRVRSGGRVQTTRPGRAGPPRIDLNREVACQVAGGLLRQGVQPGAVAEVLGLPEAVVQKFPLSATDDAQQREWYGAATAARDTAAAAAEPHFAQVLHVPTRAATEAVLELVDAAGAVLADATLPLSPGRLEGPIALSSPHGPVELHGYVQLKRLRHTVAA